jgi:hypothetical protein
MRKVIVRIVVVLSFVISAKQLSAFNPNWDSITNLETIAAGDCPAQTSNQGGVDYTVPALTDGSTTDILNPSTGWTIGCTIGNGTGRWRNGYRFTCSAGALSAAEIVSVSCDEFLICGGGTNLVSAVWGCDPAPTTHTHCSSGAPMQECAI